MLTIEKMNKFGRLTGEHARAAAKLYKSSIVYKSKNGKKVREYYNGRVEEILDDKLKTKDEGMET